MKIPIEQTIHRMAIVTGGIHGRVRGNVGGVTYGAARTRVGKAVTARELVYPSNPKTAAQVLQRSIFKESLYATRHLTAACWQADFNRAIGQLPGFQSMMSIILNQTDSSEEFTAPPDTPLGDLNAPATYSLATGAGAAGTCDMTWSTELGLNGTANDTTEVIYIQTPATVDFERPAGILSVPEIRSAGAAVLTLPDAGERYIIGLYFKGVGTALGLISPCKWDGVTVHA